MGCGRKPTSKYTKKESKEFQEFRRGIRNKSFGKDELWLVLFVFRKRAFPVFDFTDEREVVPIGLRAMTKGLCLWTERFQSRTRTITMGSC
jgi:hypothetical protein